MATQTQLRRGTAAQNNSFTGAVGELSYDTENKSIRVHDGSTAGGIEVLTGNGDISAKTSDGAALTLETSDTTVTDGSVLGKIEFKAPNEASGTDAILVGAAIEAVAEGTFAADNNATELVFKTGASAAADAKMVISSTGAVGIKTTTPAANGQFSVRGAIATTSYGNVSADFSDASTGSLKISHASGVVKLITDQTLSFLTGTSVVAMGIDASGNVLVGTDDTTLYNNSTGTGTKIGGDGRLDVARSADTVATFNRTGSSDGEIIRIVSSGTTIGAIESISGDIALTSISNPIRFSINNSERMRINASGNILIGTTAEPSASQTGVRICGTNGQNFWKSSNSGTSGYDQLAFFNGNGLVGTISTSGSATAYNTSSDYRLKTDAQPMTGASDRVLALKPVNFEWIADGTRVDGFLAHEAQAVVPEAVTGTKDAMKDEEYTVTAAKGDIYTPATDAYVDEDGNNVDATNEVIHSANAEQPETLEDGQQWRETTPAVMGTRSVPDMQGIDQSKMVPLLVASLQEALARITALETRLTALENA